MPVAISHVVILFSYVTVKGCGHVERRPSVMSSFDVWFAKAGILLAGRDVRDFRKTCHGIFYMEFGRRQVSLFTGDVVRVLV